MPTSHDALITIIFALASGIFLVVLAHHWRISMIVPLLLGGILLGPHFLGVLHPEQNLGGGLKTIISLAIAVVLFEGGLSLKLSGLKQAPEVIKRLLTAGVLITWMGVATSIYFLFDFSISMALLAGSLVIVTGPTVVQPLIRRIGLNERLQNILSWEAILIDPIGVFIALLCYEWVITDSNTMTHYLGFELPASVAPFIAFFMRSFVGIVAGIVGGTLLNKILRKNIIPQELLNISVLSFALLIFGACELVEHETGILAVTVAGFWLALKDPPHLKQIKKFKLELTDMSVGLLFVLLASKLNIDNFAKLGINGIFIIIIVVVIIRPLSIYFSTRNTNLTLNEKLFLSWMAPRGIVAASMAAIVTIYLSERKIPNYEFFESFTYAIIGTTVLLQGLLSGQVAQWLNVKSPDRNGWLIIGVNTFSLEIARFIRNLGVSVTFMDTSGYNVSLAKDFGYEAVHGDALSFDELDLKYYARVGNILALTDNKDLNVRICQMWSEVVSKHRLFRWHPTYVQDKSEDIGHVVFSDLPKPSNVANEVDNEYSRMVVKTIEPGNTQERRNSVSPIMFFSNGQFMFDSSHNKHLEPGLHLLLERNDFYLARVMQENLITTLDVVDFEDMLIKLMQHISKVIPIIPYERTLAELLAREIQTPTLVGNGVAIPHTYCQELNKSICLIARISNPVLVETRDNKPISLAFLLLSPPENPKMHLRILSDIAKVVSNETIIQKIIDAGDNHEVLRLINSLSTEKV